MWPQMAARMGIRELRNSLTSTLRRVSAGETIEVTHHGRPVAQITPVGHNRLEELFAASDVTPPSGQTRPSKLFPVTTGLSASAALDDDRGER